MLSNDTVELKVIKAAFKLLEERNWSKINLSDIARQAEVPLYEVQGLFLNKGEILTGFFRAVDAAVLKRVHAEEGDWSESDASAHDRLFDILMMRFEVLQDYKPSLRNLVNGFAQADGILDISLSSFLNSQIWLLEASNINSNSFMGRLKTVGISGVYLKAFRAWLRDDDPEMSKTMAVVDTELKQGDRILKRVESFVCGCKPKPSDKSNSVINDKSVDEAPQTI